MPDKPINREHLEKFKDLLRPAVPPTWTHAANLGVHGVPFLYQLKLAGFDWRTFDDVARLLAAATTYGLLEINPENELQVRRTFE